MPSTATIRAASFPGRPLTQATSAYRSTRSASTARVESGTRASSGRSTIGASTPSTSRRRAASFGCSASLASGASAVTALEYGGEDAGEPGARGGRGRLLRCSLRRRRRDRPGPGADPVVGVPAACRDGDLARRDRLRVARGRRLLRGARRSQARCGGARRLSGSDRRAGGDVAAAAPPRSDAVVALRRRAPRCRDQVARLMGAIAVAFVLGLAAGVLSGLFGVGGGILFVPTLTLGLGLTQIHG